VVEIPTLGRGGAALLALALAGLACLALTRSQR
jgi:hypothetical protein